MTFLEFILSFCLLSIVGSFAIYGFYVCSRGEWVLTPDRGYRKTGMIFKYWSLFWEQYRETKKVYWRGDYLDQKIDLLEDIKPNIGMRVFLSDIKTCAFTDKKLSVEEVEQIEGILLVKIIQTDNNLLFYTEEPKYDWPKWVQKPISSCPICMAGPYGTIILVFFHIVSRGTFCWTYRPILCEIGFAMLFLLTLACINSILHKLLKF